MTVLEAIHRSAAFLTGKGVDSPRLQAELLLAHVLGMPRMQLYLNFERSLSASEVEQSRALVQRRGRREPLQYIVGSTSFCGLEISVNRQVLIPRPETEILAELGWSFLNEMTEGTPAGAGGQMAPGPQALDFGTGSGCLAIALAVKCPAARVQALDSSADALQTARQNAASHVLLDRISFHLSDGLAAIPPEPQFDLLVSNPPYIPTLELATLQPEVRDYEPRAALDGGEDGLQFLRRLASEARPIVKPGGAIMLEFGDGQDKPVRELFTAQKWVVEKILEDYTRRPRILIARR